MFRRYKHSSTPELLYRAFNLTPDTFLRSNGVRLNFTAFTPKLDGFASRLFDVSPYNIRAKPPRVFDGGNHVPVEHHREAFFVGASIYMEIEQMQKSDWLAVPVEHLD